MTPHWVLDLSSRGMERVGCISALHCAGWLFVCVCVCVCVCVYVSGLNEDICFHPGNVGSSWFLPVQETISSHLLSTDCSGRSKHVLSAICPGQGVTQVTRSARPNRERDVYMLFLIRCDKETQDWCTTWENSQSHSDHYNKESNTSARMH